MEYRIEVTTPEHYPCDCIVIGLFEHSGLLPLGKALDEACGGALSKVIESGDIEGKRGQSLLLHHAPDIKATRVLLIGLGKQEKFDAEQFRSAVALAARRLDDTAATHAAYALIDANVNGHDHAWMLRHMAETTSTALYRFDELKSKKEAPRHPLKTVTAFIGKANISAEDAQSALDTGHAIATGINLARRLGNLPGNICTPDYLAQETRSIAETYGMATTILDEAEMEQLGMGALLSVSHGSREEARLICIEYTGGGDEAPVVLVGKGLTFDAGGISLKPAANMDEMKYDMCGGASVLGTMLAIGIMKLPVNVVGIIPSSENLPDGNANKPGDIVTSMSGQTIEILNTDAEGRLLLCDALTYAARYKPATIIDIATLTGACVVALGAHASGLMSNDEDLAKDLLDAGNAAHDRVWQLPLWEQYQSQLDSNFADMSNVGGRKAGTITAGCFLSRFTRDYRWAHLDIAGTAWKQGEDKGATGRPVGLLTQYLMDRTAD